MFYIYGSISNHLSFLLKDYAFHFTSHPQHLEECFGNSAHLENMLTDYE